jgi:hypothetical protein
VVSSIQKFFFAHIPKTDGNSIRSALKPYADDVFTQRPAHQDGIERFGAVNKKYKTEKHSLLPDDRKLLEPGFYASLFKFASIRNPWDLPISLYFSPPQFHDHWDRNGFIRLTDGASHFRRYLTSEPNDSRPPGTELDTIILLENSQEGITKIYGRLALPHCNFSKRPMYHSHCDPALADCVAGRLTEDIAPSGYAYN